MSQLMTAVNRFPMSPLYRTDAPLYPPIDVLEDSEGVTLMVDMPGVDADRLTVQVSDQVLTLEGHMALTLPEDLKPHYVTVDRTHYLRRFTLSEELDSEAIEAKMQEGLLAVRIPRKARYKARQVPIQFE